MIQSLVILMSLIVSVSYAQKSSSEYERQAREYADQGKFKKASGAYYKAALIAKNNPDYYISAAAFYYRSHDLSVKNIKETMRLYNKAFEVSPWNKQALLSRAEYFDYAADYKSELRDLDSLLVRDRQNWEAYNMKMSVFLHKKDTVNGDLVYSEALKWVNPEKLRYIHNKYGLLCYLKGYWNRALSAYVAELKYCKESEYTDYCFLASSYYNIGKIDSACYYYKQCNIDKFPTLKSKKELSENCK